MRRRSLLRATALLFVGAQALHELRFVAVDGSGAGLVGHGDGAAHVLLSGPAIDLALSLLLSRLLARRVGWLALWPAAVLALLLSYGGQELIESALQHGHDGGFAELARGGGWVALPLAVALGALVALGVALARVADARCATSLSRKLLVWLIAGESVSRAAYRPLARFAFALVGAGRGPPFVV